MVDIFSTLKKDFHKRFVKTRCVDDLDLGLFWGWVIENFVPLELPVKPANGGEILTNKEKLIIITLIEDEIDRRKERPFMYSEKITKQMVLLKDNI